MQRNRRKYSHNCLSFVWFIHIIIGYSVLPPVHSHHCFPDFSLLFRCLSCFRDRYRFAFNLSMLFVPDNLPVRSKDCSSAHDIHEPSDYWFRPSGSVFSTQMRRQFLLSYHSLLFFQRTRFQCLYRTRRTGIRFVRRTVWLPPKNFCLPACYHIHRSQSKRPPHFCCFLPHSYWLIFSFTFPCTFGESYLPLPSIYTVDNFIFAWSTI